MRGAVIVPEGKIAARQARPGADPRRPRDRPAGQLRRRAADRPRARRRATRSSSSTRSTPTGSRARRRRRSRSATSSARRPTRSRSRSATPATSPPGGAGFGELEAAPAAVRLPGRGRGAARPRRAGRRAGDGRLGDPDRQPRALGGGDGGVHRLARPDRRRLRRADPRRLPLPRRREGVFCEPASAASVAGLLAHGAARPPSGEPTRDGRLRAHRPRPQGPRHRARQGALGDRLPTPTSPRSSARLRLSAAHPHPCIDACAPRPVCASARHRARWSIGSACAAPRSRVLSRIAGARRACAICARRLLAAESSAPTASARSPRARRRTARTSPASTVAWAARPYDGRRPRPGRRAQVPPAASACAGVAAALIAGARRRPRLLDGVLGPGRRRSPARRAARLRPRRADRRRARAAARARPLARACAARTAAARSAEPRGERLASPPRVARGRRGPARGAARRRRDHHRRHPRRLRRRAARARAAPRSGGGCARALAPGVA